MYGEEQLEMDLGADANDAMGYFGLLAERERTHGKFEKTSVLSQQLKNTYRSGGGAITMEMAEALDQICFKMARIAHGNSFHIDHWRDIAGYATLVADILEKTAAEAEEEKKKAKVEEAA